MAYTSTDLFMLPQSIAGLKKWHYNSVDATSLVSASSYVTDAGVKGMSAGDQIVQYNSSTPKLTSYLVATVRSASSADLSTGLTLSS